MFPFSRELVYACVHVRYWKAMRMNHCYKFINADPSIKSRNSWLLRKHGWLITGAGNWIFTLLSPSALAVSFQVVFSLQSGKFTSSLDNLHLWFSSSILIRETFNTPLCLCLHPLSTSLPFTNRLWVWLLLIFSRLGLDVFILTVLIVSTSDDRIICNFSFFSRLILCRAVFRIIFIHTVPFHSYKCTFCPVYYTVNYCLFPPQR